MTREVMAQACEQSASDAYGTTDALLAAAAELRKTCATCRWWDKGSAAGLSWSMCQAPGDVANPERSNMMVDVPADGSGFCHRWEEK